jgi:hypothetical protein
LHLIVLFKQKVDAAHVHRFLKNLTSDWQSVGLTAQPEIFPKTADVRTTPKKLGNWLRLLGRHPTHEDHYPRCYELGHWLEGKNAVEHVLHHRGNDPQRLPVGSADDPKRVGDATRGAPRAGGGNAVRPEWAGLAPLATFTCSEEDTEDGIPDHLMDKVRRAVARSLPKRVRMRDSIEFRLAQAIKGIKEDWTGKQLRLIFDLWYSEAKQFMRRDETYCWVEFRRAFTNCKIPGGMTVQKVKKRSAKETVPPQASHHPEGVQALIKACAYLQRLAGDKPFPLSCEWATEIMDCKSKRTAWRAFKLLEDEGILRLVETGNRETGNASTWLYLSMIEDHA